MKKTFAKLFLIVLIPFTLTACFGSNESPETESTTPTTGESLYEGGGFTIIYPQNWELLQRDNFTSNVPLETVVAFRNNVKSDIFTANVNVSISNIEDNLSAEDFAKSSLAKLKTSLVNFQEISNTAISENAQLIEFEGKKSASEPIIHFRQLHVTDGANGYTVTAAYLPNENESVVNSLNSMLNSFSLK